MSSKLKEFTPRVVFQASPEMIKKLQPIRQQLFKESGAVLGQVFLRENTAGKKVGRVEFSFLPKKQYDIIQAAIIKAKKSL